MAKKPKLNNFQKKCFNNLQFIIKNHFHYIGEQDLNDVIQGGNFAVLGCSGDKNDILPDKYRFDSIICCPTLENARAVAKFNFYCQSVIVNLDNFAIHEEVRRSYTYTLYGLYEIKQDVTWWYW